MPPGRSRWNGGRQWGRARNIAKLMERAGVSHRSHFRRKHLKPLLEAGLVRMTNPGNPRAPNQKYVLTDGVRAEWGWGEGECEGLAMTAPTGGQSAAVAPL